jgi:hypothetical protein
MKRVLILLALIGGSSAGAFAQGDDRWQLLLDLSNGMARSGQMSLSGMLADGMDYADRQQRQRALFNQQMRILQLQEMLLQEQAAAYRQVQEPVAPPDPVRFAKAVKGKIKGTWETVTDRDGVPHLQFRPASN